jgi:hypothetical protein
MSTDSPDPKKDVLALTAAERAKFELLIYVEYDGTCYIKECDLIERVRVYSAEMEKLHRSNTLAILKKLRDERMVARSRFSQLLAIARRYSSAASGIGMGYTAELMEAERLLSFAEEKVKAATDKRIAGNIRVVDKFSLELS